MRSRLCAQPFAASSVKKWAERWREGQPTPTLALFQILSLGDTMENRTHSISRKGIAYHPSYKIAAQVAAQVRG